MARTSRPWAIRPRNGVCSFTYSSSMCSGSKSPDRPANAVMSASVTVRLAVSTFCPTERSSRYVGSMSGLAARVRHRGVVADAREHHADRDVAFQGLEGRVHDVHG